MIPNVDDGGYWAELSAKFADQLPRIKEIVAGMPPLAPEQVEELRYLLHGDQ